jgi:diacylglycerol kinase family enzyme
LPRGALRQLDVLAAGRERCIDVGCVRYGTGRSARERYFVNVASFGLSGVTDRLMSSRARRWLPPRWAFQLAVLRALGVYRNAAVRLRVSDGDAQDVRVKVVAVCNGQYFGGGMRIAPMAALDDGRLDVIVVGDISVWRLVRNLASVYRGEHLTVAGVTADRGRRVTAEPVPRIPGIRQPGAEAAGERDAGDILMDIDGEGVGALPAAFEVCPGALRVRSF